MVKVEHEGKTYALTTIGGSPTWVNHRNIVVSIELQNLLRSRAIADGVDKSVFSVKQKSSAAGSKPKTKRARSKKESLGVKLFSE